jgi:tRNA dimethylallyltransferase
VALLGPTGTGKTDVAHEIAAEVGGVEVVSVDSMTVYRGMDLGTSKPSVDQRAEVLYHLVDVAEPHEEFTLGRFVELAEVSVTEARARGHVVIFVGGTGLYARAMTDELEVPGQFPEVRAELEALAPTHLDTLYAELLVADPLAASRMEPTNARRVVRALEVVRGSGRPFSSYGPGLQEYPASPVVMIGIDAPPTTHDEALARRFHEWMEAGLVAEVQGLASTPLGLSRTARQGVGYRQLLEHIENGATLESCVASAIVATRRLARHQRSWFRRDPRIGWTDAPGARAALRDSVHELARGMEE